MQRMTIPEILENEWFKKDYKPAQFQEEDDVNLDDVDAVFNNSKVKRLLRSQFNLVLWLLSTMNFVVLFIRKIVGERFDYFLGFLFLPF